MTFKIVGASEAQDVPCLVRISAHAPITFRSREAPLPGARYIRLGNFASQLLEFQFPRESLVLSGFTLVMADIWQPGHLLGEGPVEAGLPIFDLSETETFSVTARVPRLDIHTAVGLMLAYDRAEVRIGASESFNRTVAHGRVRFLLLGETLSGIQIINLTSEEIQSLGEYLTRRQG
jgi:hypothetical protein